MKRRTLLATAPVVVAAAANADVPPALSPIRASVERAMSEQIAAWNAGELERFCSYYSDGCVFLSPSGVTRGRAEVLARYQKKYGAAKETMGKLAIEILGSESSEFLTSFAGRWTLEWKDKPAATGLTLIVWRKDRDKWKLVQDASM